MNKKILRSITIKTRSEINLQKVVLMFCPMRISEICIKFEFEPLKKMKISKTLLLLPFSGTANPLEQVLTLRSFMGMPEQKIRRWF